MVSLVMLWQSKWLIEQAKIGRFYYLPIEEVIELLREVNFTDISYKLTYANLAWIVSCYLQTKLKVSEKRCHKSGGNWLTT